MNILVILAALVSAATTPAPDGVTLPIRDVPVASATVRAEPNIYAQCDPRWSNRRMHNARLCTSGCAFFALRRAFEEAGLSHEPVELLELFQQHRVFNSENNIRWTLITDALPVVVTRVPNAAISPTGVQEQMNRGKFVILELGGSGNQHWVFAAQVVGDDIVIDDSRGGVRVSLTERYPGRPIIGYAVIERLPIEET